MRELHDSIGRKVARISAAAGSAGGPPPPPSQAASGAPGASLGLLGSLGAMRPPPPHPAHQGSAALESAATAASHGQGSARDRPPPSRDISWRSVSNRSLTEQASGVSCGSLVGSRGAAALQHLAAELPAQPPPPQQQQGQQQGQAAVAQALLLELMRAQMRKQGQ